MQNAEDQQAVDEKYLRHALELARRGAGWVNPNPQVGCVLVREGRIIGEGWHTRYGEKHAEREALADASARGESLTGATAYVTLEPCCHQGKQPPCTDALIAAGISRVVMGAPDPNPLVAGKGVRLLREAGITVDEGVLAQECFEINRYWFRFISTGRPFVICKYAMTADGKIATHAGASEWLTGAAAVERTHKDRAAYAAIMVGIGTVLADDPQLTCRMEPQVFPATAAGAAVPAGVKQPLRVVVDSQARTPLESRLVTSAGADAPVLVAVTGAAPSERIDALRAAGVQVEVLPDVQGHVDLDALLVLLGQQGVDSLIVEGGPQIHAAMIRAGLVNQVQVYVAGRIFGGAEAPGPVAGALLQAPEEGLTLANPQVELLGPDILIQWDIEEDDTSPKDDTSPVGLSSFGER